MLTFKRVSFEKFRVFSARKSFQRPQTRINCKRKLLLHFTFILPYFSETSFHSLSLHNRFGSKIIETREITSLYDAFNLPSYYFKSLIPYIFTMPRFRSHGKRLMTNDGTLHEQWIDCRHLTLHTGDKLITRYWYLCPDRVTLKLTKTALQRLVSKS